jgi:uncharacterized NAD(P)/FAD-binding protein YdhS
MQPRSATIAIIGGGFSGTVLAANLLRRPPPGPTRIILVERPARIGWGVAYGSSAYPYLLNVPAARMSATSYEPSQLICVADAVAAIDTRFDRYPLQQVHQPAISRHYVKNAIYLCNSYLKRTPPAPAAKPGQPTLLYI